MLKCSLKLLVVWGLKLLVYEALPSGGMLSICAMSHPWFVHGWNSFFFFFLSFATSSGASNASTTGGCICAGGCMGAGGCIRGRGGR